MNLICSVCQIDFDYFVCVSKIQALPYLNLNLLHFDFQHFEITKTYYTSKTKSMLFILCILDEYFRSTPKGNCFSTHLQRLFILLGVNAMQLCLAMNWK